MELLIEHTSHSMELELEAQCTPLLDRLQTWGESRTDLHSLAATSSRRGLIGGEEMTKSRSREARDEEEIYVDVTEGDQADLDAVAELARPGYPKLEKILDEEIARSEGKIMVACALIPL